MVPQGIRADVAAAQRHSRNFLAVSKFATLAHMSYNPGDPRGPRGYSNYNSQRFPGANPNDFPQRPVESRPQQQYRGDAYNTVGGNPTNRAQENPQFTGGSFFTNQSAPQAHSPPSPDVDLISFDDDASETVSVASSVPMSSHMPSNQHFDDSRSESSADGRHSAASGIVTQRIESRVSEFSVTTRTNSSVESLAISTSKLSITNVNPAAAPARPLYQELIVAPKKAPANRQDKEKVMLTTNFYALVVHSKIVYRYDINITLLRPSGKPNINLAKGPRDDAARTERNAFCVAALRSALETYRALREGEAFVYDGASIMFSSDSLDYVVKEPLMVNPCHLPPEFRRFLNHYADVSEIAIEVTPCKDTASSFDISQFQAAHNNRDMAHLDRTWKQFFDMLTNQDAISNGRFHNFGAGKLFSNSDRREDARGGQERVRGLNKGIKFIEATREPGRAVAALLLDSKIGQFFKSQHLLRTVCEYMNWPANPNQPFSFAKVNDKMNRDWKKVHELVKGLRMTFVDGSNTTFVATGISEVPLSALTEKDVSGVVRPVIDRFPSLNPGNTRMHWPAIVVRSRFGPRVVTLYYPMDILKVAPNQRVPKNKLDDNPPRADKPANRFREISRLIEAMNLHAGGRNNNFLRAFGVTLSERPLQVEGFRRARPKIIYGNGAVSMDNTRASWRIPSGKYKAPATADTIVLAWSCPIDFANAFRDNVGRMLQERGVQVGNWDWIQVDTGCGDMKLALDKLFEEIKAKKESYGGSRILVFFVDTKDTKSHGLLKLYERRTQIMTQHVSQEVAIKMIKQNQAQTVSNIINKLNCKLTGLNHSVVPDVYTQNAWITDNKSLIIGYDVAHPPPQIRADILDKKPPLSPSVVGISFNGGPHSESFIGDFHYQEPRKEEVSDHVLIARVKWILQLYTKNRGQLPENIFIIRDGVSEGQYQMVMDREMDAIRQGVEEYCNLTRIQNYSPKYVCVVVTKRHNARFVRETQQGIENPLPGTVVDTAVTRPDMSEFYMQSHRVLQGTGKAPSYVVLVDDLNLSMDQLQSFLLALCFSHQIFEGSISLPEPVYQADEWAKRGNDIWRAFDENFNLRFCKDNGDYSSPPVDFEKMTALLSYWNSSLQECRINA